MSNASGPFPDDEDGAVLASLAEAGVDLSKPLEVEFIIDAPDQASANKIAEAVRAAGYRCDVDHDEGEPEDGEDFEPSWAVFVGIEMVAEHARIGELQKKFSELAQPHGGDCDGWGVMA